MAPTNNTGPENNTPPENNTGPENKAGATGNGPPEHNAAPNAEGYTFATMPLLAHLAELRRRLLRCLLALLAAFLLCWNFDQELAALLLAPLQAALPPHSQVIFFSLPEGFLAYLNVAFVASIFISSPFLFYQIWAFISPGLRPSEKRLLLPIALASSFLFCSGALFAYFIVFPYCFSFFLSYANTFISATPSLRIYLGFAINLLLAFGLIFQMPLTAFFLGRLGLISPQTLIKKRPYAIVGAFVLGAILTPPDPVSQILMALPLLLLYELSIIVLKLTARPTSPNP